MKYEIQYYEIEYGAHLFAVPVYNHNEYVECKSRKDLRTYIESKKDNYGGCYKKSKDNFMGYDYISSQGGVKVKFYQPPIIKHPKFKKI